MKKLDRSEMKNLKGGVAEAGGNCQALVGGTLVTGQTMLQASTSMSMPGDHWCCDHCCTASWADHSGCGEN